MDRIELLQALVGETCWHVSAGGATAPSFLLVAGAHIPREVPLKNPAQPEAFRRARGSVELLVWSSWRLQTHTEVLASSDQGVHGLPHVEALAGVPIESVGCEPPAWDLRIAFANGQTLVTFSDHVEPHASIPQNWELWADGVCLRTGPGSAWELDA